MKLFHVSDLHIGKILNGYGLQNNQRTVLKQIVAYAKEEKPDAVLICGDVYDKSAPSAEAGTMFDAFLSELSAVGMPILLISGNHDSGERLSYAGSFLEKHQIYIGSRLPETSEEKLKQITLTDEYGEVHFYLLPFLKPGYVRHLFPEVKNLDYQKAIEGMIERENVDWEERNVILSHQFYLWSGQKPETCDSEIAVVTAGGLDSVDAHVLEKFDYAALGHIHGGQQVGVPKIRYCGTPYKYSVSEEKHRKSLVVVELKEKGTEPDLRFLPLDAGQDVRKVKGSLQEILEQTKGSLCHDYVSITVTDDDEPFDLKEQLERVFDHILELKVDNKRTRVRLEESEEELETAGPMETFARFYEAVCKRSLNEKEWNTLVQIFEKMEVGE